MIYYLKSRFFKSNWNNRDPYQQAMVAAGHFVLAAGLVLASYIGFEAWTAEKTQAA